MILFLDFDGVLHPQYDGQAVPENVAFCHLPRFESLMRVYPLVEIVISSMWRNQFSLDNLRARFSSDIAERIVGATLMEDSQSSPIFWQREMEILRWLSINHRSNEHWVALDDAVWEFKDYRHRLVPCRSYVGLDVRSEQHLRQVLEQHFQNTVQFGATRCGNAIE